MIFYKIQLDNRDLRNSEYTNLKSAEKHFQKTVAKYPKRTVRIIKITTIYKREKIKRSN